MKKSKKLLSFLLSALLITEFNANFTTHAFFSTFTDYISTFINNIENKKIAHELSVKDANLLCEKLYKCTNLNKQCNALVSVKGNALIIGDLHGEIEATNLSVFQADKYLSENNQNYAVFLGDYFNNKKDYEKDNIIYNNDTECLIKLLDLKIKYKNRVILLSGNHEAAYANNFKKLKYSGHFTAGYLAKNKTVLHSASIIDETIEKMKKRDPDSKIATIKEFFSTLPVAAEIENDSKEKILCLHGFIPKGNNYSWINILKNSKPNEIDINIKAPLLCNLYTTKSIDTSKNCHSNEIDCICSNTLKKFITKNGYICLVRGHSHNSFENKNIFGDGSCYSIYSAVNDYCNLKNNSNSSGILIFNKNGIQTHTEYKK